MIEFGLSICSGVFATFLIWITVSVLAPIYRGWRYQAPKIEGDWCFHDQENGPVVGSARLRRSGESVDASVTRTISRGGKAISRSFKYSGKVRSGQLLLEFIEPISGGFIAGSLVLKVSSNLKALTGFTVYLDHDSGGVVSHPIWFKRTGI